MNEPSSDESIIILDEHVGDAAGIHRGSISFTFQIIDEIGVKTADGMEGFNAAGEPGMYTTSAGQAAYRLLSSRLYAEAPGTEGLIKMFTSNGQPMTYEPDTKVFRAMPVMSMPSSELAKEVGESAAFQIGRQLDIERILQFYPELVRKHQLGESPITESPS
ncbi:hypothetical protein ABLG96_13790 [Nakamurella sp. A5-74]|uniref:Uncharacterized protein n=1 Tax=Nakamurella sp. A5-74 TaxID=3158264 RepID=A0AAU8DK51_9ACTN